MDDTKKLIEKYKQELMELSRSAKRGETAPPRAPQIIGYIDDVDEETFSRATASELPNAKCEECRETPEPLVPPELSAPEPRIESEPEFPYHHEPETPPPDYSEQLEQRAGTLSEPVPTPMPAPAPAPMPAPTPSPSPMPTPSPMPAPKSGEEYEPPYSNPQMAENEPNSAQSPDLEQNGSQSQPRVFPQPQYSSFEDFKAKNSGVGSIIFRVTTAREALPVANAKCVVTKKFGGLVHEIETLYTNQSGNTVPLSLPAPPKSLSQQYDNLVQPFALYDAVVTREGYVDVVLTDIPVFDGIQSVQGVSMLPAVSDRTIESIQEVNSNAE